MKKLFNSMYAKVFTALALASAAPASFASGWIVGMKNAAELGRAGAVTATIVFFMVGLCAIGYSGKLLWDKGGERGEDIKVGRIVFTMLGGAIMVALGFIALQTVQTMGGDKGDIGNIVTPSGG